MSRDKAAGPDGIKFLMFEAAGEFIVIKITGLGI